MEQKFFVSCLLVKDRQILMLRKEKGRHLGTWLFPGGEIKDQESALDTVKREIKQDIGLTLNQVELRGIVYFMMQEFENDPVLAKTILYVFYSEDFTGELHPSNKGTLEWVPLNEIWNREIGRNDELFIPPMLENKKVTFAKFYHNKDKERVRYQIDQI
ncbi:NUDIX domain-containing protein [Tepidibacillus fermentans]|uniref:8-oxo-dGTP diphosphatase n=1 Tax=Tepidibacillus fermentans TaxID=1281767 RepID=A0A4R3KI18_9BACI|nr:NUDIX domain-containing protein [Tepidibacillus fermentans]TCS83153.1 8-oxo-dGTP diphosphatase [Tepidibacillus fermentans]